MMPCSDTGPAAAAAVPVRLHRRQFVLGPRPFRARDDWVSRPLDGAAHLSHCPELRIGWARDADGTAWALLGLAVEILEDRPDPLVSIQRARGEDVSRLYASWAGRWALLGRGEVHMDASGLLGCFWGRTPEGELWASSSPALLARFVAPGDGGRADPRRLTYEHGISWFPPPRSRFPGMHRLLPSQILDSRGGAVRPRALLPPVDRSADHDDVLEAVRLSLTTALRRLARTAGRPWLGLTGGYDSRLMLAIARAAGVDVLPFTRLTPRMSVADRALPPQLARRCGYEHALLRPPAARPADRSRLVAEHTAGHVSDGDAEPLLRGVRDDLEGVSFGGHGFAVASGFANWRLLPACVPEPGEGARRIAGLMGEPPDSTAVAGLRAWLEWVRETPHEHLDWRDRLFIEQRCAGWLGSKEQLYDLARLERFPILNAARNVSLLLGVGERRRLGSLIQVELIRRLAPDLLDYPVNPPDWRVVHLHPIHAGRRAIIKQARRAAWQLERVASRLGATRRPPPGA